MLVCLPHLLGSLHKEGAKSRALFLYQSRDKCSSRSIGRHVAMDHLRFSQKLRKCGITPTPISYSVVVTFLFLACSFDFFLAPFSSWQYAPKVLSKSSCGCTFILSRIITCKAQSPLQSEGCWD